LAGLVAIRSVGTSIDRFSVSTLVMLAESGAAHSLNLARASSLFDSRVTMTLWLRYSGRRTGTTPMNGPSLAGAAACA
jgi:hypothetical protein